MARSSRRVRESASGIGAVVEALRPLARLGDARYVLLGEATHGTRELYTWRARLTRRRGLEKVFTFLAVEGDWPDCYRVNRFVGNVVRPLNELRRPMVVEPGGGREEASREAYFDAEQNALTAKTSTWSRPSRA